MSYASVILADAPVAYWPLTESGTAAGAVYADATGHGYDVQVKRGGAYTHIAGPLVAGGTAPFSPNSPNADALWTSATSGLPYTGSPYTLEGWLYASTYDGGYHQVLAYGPSSGGNYIGILLAGFSPIGLDTHNAANASGIVNATGLNYNTWGYFALVDDAAGTFRMYINGSLVTSSAIGTSNGVSYSASNVLYLGDPGVIGASDPAPSGSLNYWYGGALSNVAIYNYALSATQVSNHYNAYSAPAPPTVRRVNRDLMGEAAQDPVTVPSSLVPWIAATFERRRMRALN